MLYFTPNLVSSMGIDSMDTVEGFLPAQASPSQEVLFYVHERHGGSVSYNVFKCLDIPQETCRVNLQKALESLINRHQALRTVLRWNFSRKRVIQETLSFEGLYTNPPIQEKEVEDETTLDNFLDTYASHIFDIANEPPLQVTLAHVASTNRLLLTFNFLYTAYDSTSWNIILRDLSALYRSHLNSQTSPDLPYLATSFAACSDWQRLRLSGELRNKLQTYWTDKLKGHKRIELPLDSSWPSSTTYDCQVYETTILPDDAANIHAYAQRQNIAVSSIFIGAYILSLSTYSNQRDVVVGVPLANRIHPECENIIGRFANVLPLRIAIKANDSTRNFLHTVDQDTKESRLHQEYPFEDLARSLGIDYTAKAHPIFQHCFDYQVRDTFERQVPVNNSGSPNWPLQEHRSRKHQHSASPLELKVSVVQSRSQTDISFSAPLALFHDSFLMDFAVSFTSILLQLVKPAAAGICMVKDLILTQNELLHAPLNSQLTRSTQSSSIAKLFEYYALRSPRSTAVVCGKDSLTYEELDIRSSRIANYLLQKGVCRGKYFAIVLDPCVDMIATALASWKIGAPYVPIYINQTPASRLSSIFKDTCVRVAVTQADYVSAIGKHPQVTCIVIDDDVVRSQIAVTNSSIDVGDIGGEDIAYCTFTSGSTGTPKGVIVPQKGVVLYAEDFRSVYFGDPSQSSVDQVILMLSKFVTDFSVEQIALGLLSGNRLVMLPKGLSDDDYKLYAYLNQNRVTYISGTPLLLSRFDCSQLPHLRILTTCGERFQSSLFDSIRRTFQGPIYSTYGVTETTIYSVVRRLEADDGYSTSVGYPAVGQKLYVANSDLQLLPPGAVGELYISGVGVTLGYLNRPEQTSKSFLTNPFINTERYPHHARIYKTGDAARYLADGSLEIRGRIDDQVKMRGFRVEPEEVRVALSSFPNIKECAVLAKSQLGDIPGQADFLVAYYSTSTGTPLLSNSLVSHLSERLALEFIPSDFIHVAGKFPTGPSGKLEVRRLPKARKETSPVYSPPRDGMETQLCQIWCSVLGVQVGVHDDFFSAGGNSISSLQLVRDMAEEAGLHVTVQELFQRRTIARISGFESQMRVQTQGEIEERRLCGPIDLLPAQQQFFTMNRKHPNHCNQCFIIRTPPLDLAKLQAAYDDLQSYHDCFRLSFVNKQGQIMQQYNRESKNRLIEELSSSNVIRLEDHLNELHASLDLSIGRVAAAAYIRPSSESTGILWMAVHRLVIDATSPHIVAHDLQSLYENRDLPPKRDSFGQWTSRVKQYRPTAGEEAYWQKVRAKVDQQDTILPTPGNSTSSITMAISESDEPILKQLGEGKLAHAEIKALLLTALSRSLRRWKEGIRAIALDDQCRESNIGQDLDFSNTIGLFTTSYPFILEFDEDPIAHVKQTTAALERIPDKGIGYGVLHGYDALPSLAFKYLGRPLTAVTHHISVWSVESGMQNTWGRVRSAEDEHLTTHILTVTASNEDDALKVDVAGRLEPRVIENVANGLRSSLIEILRLLPT